MATAYIETTIPSYYVARPSLNMVQAIRQATTREWWDEGCSGFRLFISQEVLDEVGRGEPSLAADRLDMIRDVAILEVTKEAGELSRRLLASQIIPAKAASDAVHIAVESAQAMDYLVTWNFKHIANPYIRSRLRNAVADFGAQLPVICTPEELLKDETDYKTITVRDEVIAEVHRHKEEIAAEHNFDIDALLGGLRERQSLNLRLVSRITKGEAGGGQPATRPESK